MARAVACIPGAVIVRFLIDGVFRSTDMAPRCATTTIVPYECAGRLSAESVSDVMAHYEQSQRLAIGPLAAARPEGSANMTQIMVYCAES